jgi:hypothetical protein
MTTFAARVASRILKPVPRESKKAWEPADQLVAVEP